jgi:hypothetical protein
MASEEYTPYDRDAPIPDGAAAPTDAGDGYYHAPGVDPNKKGRKPGLYNTPEHAYWDAVEAGGVEDPFLEIDPKYGGPTDPNASTYFTRFSWADPENYANARAGQASAGRDPSIDQRNFLIGRSETGAQDL